MRCCRKGKLEPVYLLILISFRLIRQMSRLFPYNFRHRGLRRMLTIRTGIVRFLALAFVHVLSQNRTEIVGKSYGNRRISEHFKYKSCNVRVESLRFLTCGLPTTGVRILPPNNQKSCGDRTIITGSPYGACTTPQRCV